MCMCAQYRQIAKSESTIHKRMVLDFNTFSDRDLFALEKIVSMIEIQSWINAMQCLNFMTIL